MSSASGLPKKPPTSAPENVRPVSPSVVTIGIDTRRWSQSAALSPVQMGPIRCVPAKNARESTNGRSSLRRAIPSAVAAW